MKERIISILLTFCLCLSLLPTVALAAGPDVWDGSTKAPSGSGSESDPYLISTGEELAWLATLPAEGSYYVQLTNDIILNDGTFDQSGNFTKTGETAASTPHAWTPTAKAVWHIDGNDHYISGLYINSDSADNVGLFSYLYGNAVQRSCVKDLTIKNSYVRLTRDNPQYGYGKAGIFAGMSYRTDFINCVGENNILSTTCYATAGIVGESDNCSFNGVHTSGSVNGSHILGGLAGRDRDSTFKNCWNETNIDNVNRSIHQCGGIAGMASNSNFYNCANLGYLHGGSRVGGIVGEAKAVTIKNCYGLSDIENYASEWNYDWETETGRNVYNIGTLAGTGASVSLSYAEDGFERNDNGETGVVPHFTGKGKLTESGTDDDLLNALNENLYEMDGEEGLNEWSRTNDGYPLPNGGSFVNTATYYNIWLDGVRVSERNQNDILKNGLASYDDGTNTLYLHDGLVVTNPYNNSLLYTEGDINLCVDGSVEFRSAQNVGGGPSVINLGEAGGSGRLKIYAPTDKSAAVTVTGAYSEYGINVNSLTLDGDVCLTVRTNEPCFAFAYTFTLLSSEAVLDAENLSGNPSMLNFVYSVNLPSTNPQKLYEGTGTDLTCVEQFTKERETESGTTEPYMYPHIRIAPEVYELIDTLPKSLTVSMTQANTEAALSTWAAGQIRTGDITTGNSEITVSDVVSAVAGSDTNQSGTDGSFTVTVKLTKNGISKTTTIPGTITATAYVPPHTHCICGGDTDVGDHTSHTDVIYQPWDGTSAIDYGDDNTAYVYLTNDVTIQKNLEITGGKTLYLCLNGKTFASNGTNKIVVKENSRFILCDCAGGGTIDGADSGWGGTGIYLYNSTMDMYGGKITGGYASGNGGGGAIALDDVNCVFNMYGGEISGNRANRYGGAIFLNGTLQSKKGGTVNLYGGTISNNSAKIGGAIYAVYGGTVNLFGGEISGNKATANGGGAICLNHSGVLNMTRGKMQNNTAKTDGGAVNLYASTFTFSGGTISNNQASEYGGAVYLSISSKLNMTGGEISNNTAAEEGGAVHVYGQNSTFNLSGGTITGNEAVDGGAVYLNQEQSTLNMSGGEISGNKATRYGGAVYMFRETSTLNLSGGTIKNNTAASSGGAVYFNTTSDGNIQGILNISGNPVVKDNTVSGKANNISLKSGKTLSIVGAMTDGASVGITTESTNYPVVFSNAYDTDYSGYFFADDANAYVRQDGRYRLELATGTPHKHSWATAWSKNETHHWHECTADGCDVTNDAEKQGYGAHSGTDDGDCTTAVICECGYVITAANAEHTYGAWHSNGDNTHTRNCTVTGCNGYETKNCAGGQASYFKKADCDTCHAEYGSLLTDSTAPTGEISIGTNKWNSFLNTITFGLFFKDTQSVAITAADDSYNRDGYTDDKAVKVAYYLHSGDTALTQADLAGKEFTEYSRAFNINPDNKYVIYAKLTDHASNVTYISSEGVVLDASAPVISGVENGKTYCEAQTVTVDEKYTNIVTVNGTAVTLNANNQFTLNPAEGTQTIVVTDKAGNVSAEITVTVNDGHTYEWQSENGQYWKKCKFCGDETAKKDIPTITIDAPDMVCRTQDCEASVTLPDGITDAVLTYEFIGLSGAVDTTVEDGKLNGVVAADGYPNVENSFNLVVYATTDDGFPFTVSKTVQIQNEHAGGVATCIELAICDTCGEPYGELDSSNHNLEKISATDATVTETGNTEYWHCKDCGKYFADENGTNEIKLDDTVISKLPPEIIDGIGQSITEGEKKELSFTSNAAFSDFLRVELDGKTLDEKNYTVKEGSTVVTLKADYVATLSAGEHTIGIVSESGTATTTFIVYAKAVVDNDTKSPQTGDNSRMALWIALLAASVFGLAGTAVYSKRKRVR